MITIYQWGNSCFTYTINGSARKAYYRTHEAALEAATKERDALTRWIRKTPEYLVRRHNGKQTHVIVLRHGAWMIYVMDSDFYSFKPWVWENSWSATCTTKREAKLWVQKEEKKQ